MWNYSEKVMDHFLNPRNAGEMENPDGVGQIGSIVCGDALKLMLKIDAETETITEAKFLTFGCGSAIASASALTELVKGMPLDEAVKLTDDDIAAYLDGLPEEKMHCSVMGTDALKAAVANFRGEAPTDTSILAGEVVCKCFNVTRKKLEEVILAHKLTEVEQVTDYTKAGGACGQCKGRIEELLAELAPRFGEQTGRALTNLERVRLVEQVFENEIRPALQSDGGDLELVDIDGKRIVVSLMGRCASCHAADATLRDFVEARLRERIEPDLEVVAQ